MGPSNGPPGLPRGAISAAERRRAGQAPAPHPRPSMMLRDGVAVMPFGTPGGDMQQQAMLQVLMNVTVFGMPTPHAIEAPRVASRSFPDSFWPHAYAPGKLEVEARPDGTRMCGADPGRGAQAIAW